MKGIKFMLLGLAIMLITIILHLFIETGFFTDLIALVGLLYVLISFCFLNRSPRLTLFDGIITLKY